MTIGFLAVCSRESSDGVWLVDAIGVKGAILNGRGARLAQVRDGGLLDFGRMLSLVVKSARIRGTRAWPFDLPVPAVPNIDTVATISTAVSCEPKHLGY